MESTLPLRFTLTRDKNGVVLWFGVPRICFASSTFMNGGYCIPLPEEHFLHMSVPGKMVMQLTPVEN